MSEWGEYRVEVKELLILVVLVFIVALNLTGCRSTSAGVDDTVIITVTGNVQDLDENSLTIGGETYVVLVSDLLDGINVGDRVTITGNPNSAGGLFVTDVVVVDE